MFFPYSVRKNINCIFPHRLLPSTTKQERSYTQCICISTARWFVNHVLVPVLVFNQRPYSNRDFYKPIFLNTIRYLVHLIRGVVAIRISFFKWELTFFAYNSILLFLKIYSIHITHIKLNTSETIYSFGCKCIKVEFCIAFSYQI